MMSRAPYQRPRRANPHVPPLPPHPSAALGARAGTFASTSRVVWGRGGFRTGHGVARRGLSDPRRCVAGPRSAFRSHATMMCRTRCTRPRRATPCPVQNPPLTRADAVLVTLDLSPTQRLRVSVAERRVGSLAGASGKERATSSSRASGRRSELSRHIVATGSVPAERTHTALRSRHTQGRAHERHGRPIERNPGKARGPDRSRKPGTFGGRDAIP